MGRHSFLAIAVAVVLATDGCSGDVVWFQNTSDQPVVVVDLQSDPRGTDIEYRAEPGETVQIFTPGECISSPRIAFEVRTVDGEVLDRWETSEVPACPNTTWVWPGDPPAET